MTEEGLIALLTTLVDYSDFFGNIEKYTKMHGAMY